MNSSCPGRGLPVVFLGLLVPGAIAIADIRVSPVALYLSDQDTHERIYVENTGPVEKEVTIDMRFGYPVSDVRGQVSFRFVKPDSCEPSAADWVSVFPQTFVLPPGESQTVAVLSAPPQGLKEGEYWARPVLSFRPAGSQGGKEPEGEDETQVVLSVNYRHGEALTGVALENLSVERSDRKVSVIVEMKRVGNAAFLGNLVCRLAAEGMPVTQESTEVAVYHTLRRRIEFSVPGKSPGVLTVEAEANARRTGNKPGDILFAPTVIVRKEFVFNPAPGRCHGGVVRNRPAPAAPRVTFKEMKMDSISISAKLPVAGEERVSSIRR